MRLNRHVWQMLALTAVVCLIALISGQRSGGSRADCTVALVPEKGMTILSENPVRVRRGGSAAFSVQFADNCFHDEASGLRYDGGVLYLDDVRESQSVRYAPRRTCQLTVRETDAGYVELTSGSAALSGSTAEIRLNPPAHYLAERVRVNEDVYAVPSTGALSFPVYDDSLISVEWVGEPVAFTVTANPVGRVRNLQEQEEYRYGDTVVLRSECDGTTVRFDGWSAGAYLNSGGTPLSTEAELSLTLSGDTDVYANFTDLHTYTVTVDPNGGSTDAALSRGDCSAGQPVYLPADTGALRRDGYALIGYNTLPDGSGQHYALASPLMIGHEDALVYAEWLPETPGDALVYELRDGYAVVRGLSRDVGATLVIPARLGGAAVRGVDANAFAGNAALTTVVIPLGVTRIGEKAFSGCPNLSMVYLPDTLSSLSGSAFGDCPAFEHLRVLSENNTHAYEKTFDSALADRYMRLLHTEGKRIILVAGSSGSFGLDSTLLVKRFPDYEIVNFSGSYLYGMMPMLFYVSNNVHPGDVVIFAPEYYGAMYANTLTSEIANWMYLESNYNMLDELNLQMVKKSILGTFTDFLSQRRDILPGRKSAHGVYDRSAFNEYGDLAARRTHQSEAKAYRPDPEIINSACVKAYAAVFETITAKGGTCLFSFPPVSRANTSPGELDPAYDAFTQKLRESFAGLPCTVISSAADYLFPPDAFYDNKYHMTTDGAILRTNRLIADLEAYGLGQ